MSTNNQNKRKGTPPDIDLGGTESSARSSSALRNERRQQRALNKSAPQNKASDNGKRSGSGGRSGGGGANSRSNKRKAFINYYRRYLQLKPNMKLVEKAVTGDYTMAEFQLLVQREDTDRFLKTAAGQQAVARFRELWARIFPSLNRQPGIRSLRKYLKERPASSYREITHPVTMRDMYAWLSKKKLFKQIYPEFEHTRFARTLDFSGYRTYSEQFRNIMRNYLGRYALYPSAFERRANDNVSLGIGGLTDEVSYFFRSRISPEEFEKNLQTYLTALPAYTFAGERPLTNREVRAGVFGRRGGMNVLQRLADAYQRVGSYMGSNPAQVGAERQQFGPSTVNIY